MPETANTPPKKLTPKQAAFVAEYLIDLNATQAAIRAGYSKKTAREIGLQNLEKLTIAEAIQAAQQRRSARTEITQDMVLQQLWDVATADPRELVEYRRTCCRYCWGIDNQYQLAQYEIDDRNRNAERTFEKRKNPKPTDTFEYPDELGGPGYDRRKSPSPDCPRCFGEGEARTFINDTRNLSAKARLLYAGVKETKDGFEVKMRDQQGALIKVGEHLGMFKSGTNVNLNIDLNSLNEAQLEHVANGGSFATLPR